MQILSPLKTMSIPKAKKGPSNWPVLLRHRTSDGVEDVTLSCQVLRFRQVTHGAQGFSRLQINLSADVFREHNLHRSRSYVRTTTGIVRTMPIGKNAQELLEALLTEIYIERYTGAAHAMLRLTTVNGYFQGLVSFIFSFL